MALLIVHEMLAGLDYAHELADFDGKPLNVIHRDVSPQNLFVTYTGEIKLIDFGIAKAANQEEVTQIGVVKGKVRFMAPEQAMASPLDLRVDVFAAGIVMWELLTGERFWGKARDLEIVRRLRKGEFAPSPDTVNPAVPKSVAAICNRALAFNREDRYANCADFLDELEGEMHDRHGTQARLAEFVGGLFVEERKTLRGIVDQATLKAGRETGSLAKILKSGVHSRSDFTVLPTTHTAPPASTEEKKPPPFPTGLLAVAAVCVALATTLLTMRLPMPGAGTAARVSAGVPASTAPAVPPPAAGAAAGNRAGDASVKPTKLAVQADAGAAPTKGGNPTGDVGSKDPEDALPENGERVYK
jgi:serine/threonine-protein kinase